MHPLTFERHPLAIAADSGDGVLWGRIAGALIALDGGFEETKHRRSKDGKFSKGGGYTLHRNSAEEAKLAETAEHYGRPAGDPHEDVYFNIRQGAKNAGYMIGTRHKARPSHLKIDMVASNEPGDLAINALGPAAIRALIAQLREVFPELKEISGKRISGGRVAAGKKKLGAKIKLPPQTASDAEFEESDHPRAKDGKFAKKGQGEAGGAEAHEEKPKTVKPAKAAKPKKEKTSRIEDIGEKIGGARKDRAASGVPKAKAQKQTYGRPEWERRYVAIQNVKSGAWHLQDTKTVSRFGGHVLPTAFNTKEEAESFRPIAAVSRNHRVYGNNDGTYSIWRNVTDRKRVKITEDSFPTRDDAMRYMAENAEKILQTKTGFGEEILAKPEKVYRAGDAVREGDVKPEVFKNDLNWRGIEFGNWQDERQKMLNHSFEALHDLSFATGIHPADLSLKGQLGLAFGARGHGLSSARAHYEPDYAVMNLTKMKGAGSLAHEWAHALDHYLGRLDEPAYAQTEITPEGHRVFKTSNGRQHMASNRVGSSYAKGKLHEDVRKAYGDLIQALKYKPEQFTEDTEKAQKFVGQAKESLQQRLDGVRKYLAEQLTYGKRHVKPATEAQLARFDKAAEKLLSSGENLSTTWRASPKGNHPSNRFSMAGRFSNDTLDDISKVIKEVRGRSGFGSGDTRGPLDELRGLMTNLSSRQKMLNDAKAQSVKTKMVPTSFHMEAKKADQGRVEDYWHTPHEMKARAFSAYVEDKLRNAGRRSDYLSYGSENKYYKLFNINPFPEGEERATFNKHFDTFFDAMRKAGLMRAVPAMIAKRSKKAKAATDSAAWLVFFKRAGFRYAA